MDFITLKRDTHLNNDIYSYHITKYTIYLWSDDFNTHYSKLSEYLLYMSIRHVYGDIIIPRFVLCIILYDCADIYITSPFLIYFGTGKNNFSINNMPLTVMYIYYKHIKNYHLQYLIYIKNNYNMKRISSKYLKHTCLW
jgi:hypothetical protein